MRVAAIVPHELAGAEAVMHSTCGQLNAVLTGSACSLEADDSPASGPVPAPCRACRSHPRAACRRPRDAAKRAWFPHRVCFGSRRRGSATRPASAQTAYPLAESWPSRIHVSAPSRAPAADRFGKRTRRSSPARPRLLIWSRVKSPIWSRMKSAVARYRSSCAARGPPDSRLPSRQTRPGSLSPCGPLAAALSETKPTARREYQRVAWRAQSSPGRKLFSMPVTIGSNRSLLPIG
jgi:hypothetical protein